MKKPLLIATIFSIISFNSVHAAWLRTDSLDVKLRVGYNIGGTAPLGMPATIRSIDAFRPTASLRIGADATLPLGDKWGLSAGLLFENKGMDVEVTTKSYRMEMSQGGAQISGLFTGHVKQEVTQWMFTLPITINYRISDFKLKAGPYLSLLVSKGFSGIAYDGYLRQGNPTGPRIGIGSTEADRATYDFSDDMRSLQWGVCMGVDWQITSRMGLWADLSWGLSGIFQSDFKTVEQTLYPIYGSVGVFYKL